MLEFADDTAFERIPANGTNIKVAVPVVKKDLPGGLGLADLQGLLEPQERDPNLAADAPEGAPGAGLGLYGTPISVVNDAERPTRVVEVVVQRASASSPLLSLSFSSPPFSLLVLPSFPPPLPSFPTTFV